MQTWAVYAQSRIIGDNQIISPISKRDRTKTQYGGAPRCVVAVAGCARAPKSALSQGLCRPVIDPNERLELASCLYQHAWHVQSC